MTPAEASLHQRLRAGREALGELTRQRREPRLVELLQRLDDVLLDTPGSESWGVCEVCHDVIAPDALEEHPLISVCLECMTSEQRDALERDLHSAAEVQRMLLPPKHLFHDGWEVQYLWEPYGPVSGDHVDVVRPPSEREAMHLLVGDVAGKGLAASMLQSQLHALFRALAPLDTKLCALLRRANQLLFEATGPSRYATLTATRLHADGRVVLANAGHPRPLLADRRGVRPLEGASIPLGMFGETNYEERHIRMREGDTLLLYTDGLTEAWSREEEYGVGRAAAALRRARERPLAELVVACRDDLEDFLGGAPRGDDLTIVAVRRSARQET